MELHLNRRLAERRIYPAFDIDRSSTRREELLLEKDALARVWLMRRMLAQLMASPPGGAGYDIGAATEVLVERISGTRSNAEFLALLNRDSS
jgi:transcription termination factor Rho